jgi:hypothetical protein
MSARPDGLTHEAYLGDGAYVGFDGYHVVVYTTDGIRYTRPVYMEPAVLETFLQWARDFKRAMTARDAPAQPAKEAEAK